MRAARLAPRACLCKFAFSQLAEEVRFELTVPCGTAHFKCAGINHYPTPPDYLFTELEFAGSVSSTTVYFLATKKI